MNQTLFLDNNEDPIGVQRFIPVHESGNAKINNSATAIRQTYYRELAKYFASIGYCSYTNIMKSIKKYTLYILILLPLGLEAQITIEWDGNMDGDGDGISWNDPLNWTTDVLPMPFDNVCLCYDNEHPRIPPGSIIEIKSLTIYKSDLTIELDAMLVIKSKGESAISMRSDGGDIARLMNHGTIDIESTQAGMNLHGIQVSNDAFFTNEESGYIKISDIAGVNASAISVSFGSLNNLGLIEIFNTKDDKDIKQGGESLFSNDGDIICKNDLGSTSFQSSSGKIKGNGTIKVDHFTCFNSYLDPGPYDPFLVEDPGVFTIEGDAELLNTTVLHIDVQGIQGPGDQEGHDQLSVTGDLTLSDTFRVEFLNAYFPDSADYINVIDYGGTLINQFDELIFPSPIMDHWSLDYDTNPGKVILFNNFCTQTNFQNCTNEPCWLWSGHYKVSDRIQYGGGYEILNGERVILDAANSVAFPSGFEVKPGAELEIRTMGCNP